MPTAPTALLVAAAAATEPTPWYLSQPVGFVLGALVAAFTSFLVAATNARATRQNADAQRTFDRVESRRETRRAACATFLAETGGVLKRSRAFEEESQMRPGEVFQDAELERSVEDALADLAIEVPDDVYALAVHLRNQVTRHVWGWDPSGEQSDFATDEEVNTAEANLRRAIRTMLAND